MKEKLCFCKNTLGDYYCTIRIYITSAQHVNITFVERERIFDLLRGHLMKYQFHHSVKNNNNEKPNVQ